MINFKKISTSTQTQKVDVGKISDNDNHNLFASILNNETNKIENNFSAGDSYGEEGLDKMMRILKEKGFVGLFKEIEKEKIKELREKILNELGLTEEDLAKLPQEKRAAIEEIISDEIQRRMALGSMEKDKDKDNDQPFDSIINDDISKEFSAAGIGILNTSDSFMTRAFSMRLSEMEGKKDK